MTTAPAPLSARFTLELEFVLCLSNPGYLSYLATTYPHLLNQPTDPPKDPENTDAACFARYLAYLYEYWKKPKYSQYLTHPGATLRNLELLQHEQFRKDLINVGLINKLAQMEVAETAQPNGEEEQNQDETNNATVAATT